MVWEEVGFGIIAVACAGCAGCSWSSWLPCGVAGWCWCFCLCTGGLGGHFGRNSSCCCCCAQMVGGYAGGQNGREEKVGNYWERPLNVVPVGGIVEVIVGRTKSTKLDSSRSSYLPASLFPEAPLEQLPPLEGHRPCSPNSGLDHFSLFEFDPCIFESSSFTMAELTERDKMLRGELFCAFTPDMVAARARCKYACNRFNNTSDEVPRRRLVEMWRE